MKKFNYIKIATFIFVAWAHISAAADGEDKAGFKPPVLYMTAFDFGEDPTLWFRETTERALQWRALNPALPIYCFHNQATSPEVEGITLVSYPDIITDIVQAIFKLCPNFTPELWESVLNNMFLGEVPIYAKCDFARFCSAVWLADQFPGSPKTPFFYASSYVTPTNLAEFPSVYASKLEKFGIVFAYTGRKGNDAFFKNELLAVVAKKGIPEQKRAAFLEHRKKGTSTDKRVGEIDDLLRETLFLQETLPTVADISALLLDPTHPCFLTAFRQTVYTILTDYNANPERMSQTFVYDCFGTHFVMENFKLPLRGKAPARDWVKISQTASALMLGKVYNGLGEEVSLAEAHQTLRDSFIKAVKNALKIGNMELIYSDPKFLNRVIPPVMTGHPNLLERISNFRKEQDPSSVLTREQRLLRPVS